MPTPSAAALAGGTDPDYLDDDQGDPDAVAQAEAEARLEELRSAIKGAFEDACDHTDNDLSPQRQRAQDYYDGLIYGRADEPEELDSLQGRSTIVSREVADIVHQMLPGLIRVFTSGDRVVDFVPTGPENEAQAEQQTEYVNFCLSSDGNSWFTTLHDAVHDALLKKSGIIKWWWESSTEVTEARYTGLDPLQVERLAAEPGVEIVSQTQNTVRLQTADLETPPPGAGPTGAATAAGGPPVPPAAPPAGALSSPAGAAPPGAPAAPGSPPGLPPFIELPAVDCTIRRSRKRACLRLAAVPPEEFVTARDSRDIQTGIYCAHRTLPTVSELVAQGLADRETIEDLAREGTDFAFNTEAQQRQPARGYSSARGVEKANWRVLQVEHYYRHDSDDDGIAELHRIVTYGDACEEIVDDQIVAEVPMAVGSPVRLPHSVIGASIADQTLDLQDLKSGIMRSIMDSMAEALDPRTTVVENQVNLSDVLSNERGAVIRQKAPGMVGTLPTQFIAAEAMGVLSYVDQVKAQRTGITAQSSGLSPEVLQSTTKSAADNTIERSQERVEMIARTLAETLVRQVFRGVLRCIVQHQDQPRTVRMRGKWVSVDPRFWDAECDVAVNVALGRGPDSSRMAFLGLLAGKQEQILTMIGPDNPLVGIRQLRNTYAEMCRLAGFKDADRFFLDPSIEEEEAAKKAAAANKPKSPEEMLAEAQIKNGEIKAQTTVRAQELELWKAQQADDRERDRLEAEIFLRSQEIQAQYGTQIDTQQIQAQIQRDRTAATSQVQARGQDLQHERETAAQHLQHQREQEATQLQHERETQAAQLAAQQPQGAA